MVDQDIALRRSEHEGARARYEEAQPKYRQVGAVLGEANCIRRLGDIDAAQGHKNQARVKFEQALRLYRGIAEPYSMGGALLQLARLEKDRKRRGGDPKGSRQVLDQGHW